MLFQNLTTTTKTIEITTKNRYQQHYFKKIRDQNTATKFYFVTPLLMFAKQKMCIKNVQLFYLFLIFAKYVLNKYNIKNLLIQTLTWVNFLQFEPKIMDVRHVRWTITKTRQDYRLYLKARIPFFIQDAHIIFGSNCKKKILRFKYTVRPRVDATIDITDKNLLM